MALPKAHRLRRRQEFSQVYQLGSRRSSAHLTLRALRARSRPLSDCERLEKEPVRADSATRIGISVSLKVSKRSVVRNRIRRQLKAAFRQLLPDISPGWQLVIVVKPNATECDFPQFLQELKQLLINAEVIHGHSGRGVF